MTEPTPRAHSPQVSRRLSLTVREAATIAVHCLEELTDKPCQGAASVLPHDDGWIVEVEVVEDRRIPATTDILALYEVEIGRDGTVRSYRRTRRYGRGSRDPLDGELQCEQTETTGDTRPP